MGIKSEGELKMKKTIVLLLSLATIMACIAAPVVAADYTASFVLQTSGDFDLTVKEASKVTEFHGISMDKAKFKIRYIGQPDIKIGLRVNGKGTLYGGKSYTTLNRSSYGIETKYSNQVAQSIGANVPHIIFL